VNELISSAAGEISNEEKSGDDDENNFFDRIRVDFFAPALAELFPDKDLKLLKSKSAHIARTSLQIPNTHLTSHSPTPNSTSPATSSSSSPATSPATSTSTPSPTPTMPASTHSLANTTNAVSTPISVSHHPTLTHSSVLGIPNLPQLLAGAHLTAKFELKNLSTDSLIQMFGADLGDPNLSAPLLIVVGWRLRIFPWERLFRVPVVRFESISFAAEKCGSQIISLAPRPTCCFYATQDKSNVGFERAKKRRLSQRCIRDLWWNLDETASRDIFELTGYCFSVLISLSLFSFFYVSLHFFHLLFSHSFLNHKYLLTHITGVSYPYHAH
jgi:hypothetical protein